MNNLVTKSPFTDEVPLGVLLSEEISKSEVMATEPTSCYWTGGPDSCEADEDQ